MIKIISLGGSGEDSRNCFLLKSDKINILFDCGVRREIASVERVYPALNEEIAASLDAVILSHAHEDHTAALPYLYHLGYRKKVYASKETIKRTTGFMNKWVTYVINNGGTLPFDPDDVNKVEFEDIDRLDLDLSWGRSGHIVGSLWYLLKLEGHRILYTGDITYDSLLLDYDELPEADTLIIDSAYAGKVIHQQQQYETLRALARTVKGRLLLPVPANGRGIDMAEYLRKHEDINLYVEDNIQKNADNLFKQENWIRDFTRSNNCYKALTDEIRNSTLPGTYVFSDGMMTTPLSETYLETVKNDSESMVVISGHSAKGTLANSLLKEDYRQEENIKLKAWQLTIKVHLDQQDVIETVNKVKAERVMLFHSRKENCTSLIQALEEKGIQVVCDTCTPLAVN